MATLNDIESQLDDVITALQSGGGGGGGGAKIYAVSYNSDTGIYSLSDSKTFSDIAADIAEDILPVLKYGDTYYYLIGKINDPYDGDKVFAWCANVVSVNDNSMLISIFYANGTNQLYTYGKYIT